jgi:hypothetical protein
VACLLQVSASLFLVFSSFLLISTQAQQSWLDKTTVDRFHFPQCMENRTWSQLVSTYSSVTMISGGLGGLSSAAFAVWTCFAYHPCLGVVTHAHGDLMCYVFNEEQHHWYPWCLNSERVSCKSGNGTTLAPLLSNFTNLTQLVTQGASYAPGLSYNWYSTPKWMPETQSLPANWESSVLNTGIHTDISNQWQVGEYFSVEYNGFFYTNSSSGIFSFFCSADNYSEVVITDSEGYPHVVCLAYCCDRSHASGTISLAANEYYKIKIRFSQGWGPGYLTIAFSHDQIPFRTDGHGFYFHKI